MPAFLKAMTRKLVERGERPCLTCRKVHHAYKVPGDPLRWGSWASLKDGHSYRAESWESLARKAGAV